MTEAKTMTLVERLKAIDEEAMYHAPASTHATIAEAISLLEAAERALEPFAKLGQEIDEAESMGVTAHGYNPTQDDLRLARSVRDKIKGEAS